MSWYAALTHKSTPRSRYSFLSSEAGSSWRPRFGSAATGIAAEEKSAHTHSTSSILPFRWTGVRHPPYSGLLENGPTEVDATAERARHRQVSGT